MPLEPVQLDDLTWSDLTTAARDRIAGVSQGEWTLHAPVDPGITLLELFATQLEQRLFWMDQPSDERTAAMLSLLGLRPKPGRVAGTVLCLGVSDDDAASCGHAWVVPADTVMEHGAAESAVRFRTTQPIRLLPVEWKRNAGPADVASSRVRARKRASTRCETDLRLQVGREDRTAELAGGRMPCLLPADGRVRETRIAVKLNTKALSSFKDAPEQKEDFVSLLFDLDTPAGIRAQWIPQDDSGDDSPPESEDTTLPEKAEQCCGEIPGPASLSWSFAFSNDETPTAATDLHRFTRVEDGTCGFRRSGVVRLSAADLMTALDGEPTWLVIAIHASTVSYSYLPRVRQIVPNSVLAEHRLTYRFSDGDADDALTEQIESWEQRRLPGSKLRFDLEPHEPLLVDSVRLCLRERISGEQDSTKLHTWRPAADFSRFGPDDRVFVADRDRRSLSFGDGLNGRLPIPQRPVGLTEDDPELFSLDLDIGGGEAGNLPGGKGWVSRSLYSLSIDGEGPDTGQISLLISRQACRKPISAKATAEQIESAIQHLPAFRCGNAQCSGGPLPKAVWINFGQKRDLTLSATGTESDETLPVRPVALRAVNVIPAEGGEDAESLDDAARRARSELRRVRRAVTQPDIERLAQETPGAGIARAHAVVGLHPEHPCMPVPGAVTVFIVPDLPPSLRRFRERSCGDDLVALRPDPGAMAAVAGRLNAARLITHEIHVCSPVYEPFDLSVLLSGTPIDPGGIRETITDALHEYLHPLFGGPDRDGWPFGGPVRPSELVRIVAEAIDSELGVEQVGVRKRNPTGGSATRVPPAAPACCADDPAPDDGLRDFEHCDDVEIRRDGLVALRGVRIEFAPTGARTGGLL